jgi:hypothetical protein
LQFTEEVWGNGPGARTARARARNLQDCQSAHHRPSQRPRSERSLSVSAPRTAGSAHEESDDNRARVAPSRKRAVIDCWIAIWGCRHWLTQQAIQGLLFEPLTPLQQYITLNSKLPITQEPHFAASPSAAGSPQAASPGKAECWIIRASLTAPDPASGGGLIPARVHCLKGGLER